MKKDFIKIGLANFIPALFLMPFVASAFTANTFADLVYGLVDTLKLPIISLLTALSVGFFLFGVVKFIKGAGDEKAQGKMYIIYGLIGLVVILSLEGIIALVTDVFGLSGNIDSAVSGAQGLQKSGGGYGQIFNFK